VIPSGLPSIPLAVQIVTGIGIPPRKRRM